LDHFEEGNTWKKQIVLHKKTSRHDCSDFKTDLFSILMQMKLCTCRLLIN